MRPTPRPAVVRGNVALIQLTRGLYAVVDAIDADLGAQRWHPHRGRNGKAYARRKDSPHGPATWLHRTVAERAGIDIDGRKIDHRDGDGLNCRRENLRAATDTQNAQNRRLRNDNRTGATGVNWHRQAQKWRASIQVDGIRISLGLHATVALAAEAYRIAALKYFGEFAAVNREAA